MDGICKKLLYFIILVPFLALSYKKTDCVKYIPTKNINLKQVFANYQLRTHGADLDSFNKWNSFNQKTELIKGKTYYLPILKFLKIPNQIQNKNTLAKIEKYNLYLIKSGLKPLKQKAEIWIPLHYLITTNHKVESNTSIKKVALLGSKNANVDIVDQKLKQYVFYLISGHGGPDPGANIKVNNHLLCEDEYAYDIILRLGKNLISHGATVYFIVQDKNDGIRNEEILKADHDEVLLGNIKMPINQKKRLNQRTQLINNLSKKQDKNKKQILFELHIDSRSIDEQIDIFFYHFPGSAYGKTVAENLLKTIKEKYETHQQGRGYNGVVKPRDLFSLRESKIPGIYVEIGNITNEKDRIRIMLENNRQAIANWLTEGLMR